MTEPSKEVLSVKSHTYGVTFIGFSQDERQIISTGGDGEIHIRDITSGDLVMTIQAYSPTAPIVSACLSDSGEIFATASLGHPVILWSMSSGEKMRNIDQFEDVCSLAFSPDLLLACGTAFGPIRIWDSVSEREIATFIGHEEPICSLAFSPNGKLLASASEDSTVKLWRIANRRCIRTYRGQYPVHDITFSPDGAIIAVSKSSLSNTEVRDGQVKLLPVSNGPLSTLVGRATGRLSPVILKRDTKYVRSLDFSPSGQLLAFAPDKHIELWDVKNRKLTIRLNGDIQPLDYITFSPSGALLAYGTVGGYVKLLKLHSTF